MVHANRKLWVELKFRFLWSTSSFPSQMSMGRNMREIFIHFLSEYVFLYRFSWVALLLEFFSSFQASERLVKLEIFHFYSRLNM